MLVRRAAIASAVLVSVAWASQPVPGCKAWTFFFGGNCNNCTNATEAYGLAPHSLTQTGNACQTPDCKPWTQGAFPTLKRLADGKLVPDVNGGVPQRASLKMHLTMLEQQVVNWLPDPEYSGNAVFDFETWTPVYSRNDGTGSWHSKDYQEYSEQLVRQAHPSWTKEQVQAEAQAEFESAAIAFFVQTLETVRSLRKKARWGFYGFPQNPYTPCMPPPGPSAVTIPACGYNGPDGPALRKENDALQAIFNASSGLFPSVYIPQSPSGWSPDQFRGVNAQYVAAVTAEAVRLARAAPPGVVVRPYAWAFYHNGTNTLSPQDTASVASKSYQPPEADGVVLWGDATYFGTTQLMERWLTGPGGADMQDFQAQQCGCSASTCSGNGACRNATAGGCICFPGYSGPDCSQHA